MKRALAKGAFIIGSARFVANVVSLLSNVALARLLIPSDFGLVAIAGTIWALILSLTEVPISSLLLQLDTIEPAHYDAAWTVNFVRTLLIAVVMCAFAWPASQFYGDDRIAPLMFAMGAISLVGNLRSPRIIDFTKQLRFDVDNKVLVAQKVIGVVASVAIAYFTHSYWAIVLGTLASDACSALLSQWYAPYRPRFSNHESKFFIRQGLWLSLTQVVGTLNARADALIIGYLGSQTLLGRYALGSSLASIPTRETQAPLAQTLLPSFALLRSDLPRTRSAYKKAQALLFAVALPAGVGTSILTPFLVHQFLGDRWRGTEPIIATLSVLFGLQSLGTLSGPLALARSENRLLSIRSLIVFAVRIPAIIVGYMLGGLHGFLAGLCVAGATETVCTLFVVRKIIGLPVLEQLAANANTVLAAAAMALVVALLPNMLHLSLVSDPRFAITAVLVGVVSYVAVHVAAAALRPASSALDLHMLHELRKLWPHR